MTTFRKRTKKDIVPVDKRVNAVPVYMDELNDLIDGINAFADVVESRATALETYQAGGTNTTEGKVSGIYTKEVTLDATTIVGTDAGDIGHAEGAILVTAPGATKILEFISAVLIYDFDTAAYTGGGDDNVIQLGTTAVSKPIAGADLLGAAADKIVYVNALGDADVALAANQPLAFHGTALTQPGTAAGTLSIRISYRVHTI